MRCSWANSVQGPRSQTQQDSLAWEVPHNGPDLSQWAFGPFLKWSRLAPLRVRRAQTGRVLTMDQLWDELVRVLPVTPAVRVLPQDGLRQVLDRMGVVVNWVPNSGAGGAARTEPSTPTVAAAFGIDC